MGQRRDAQLRLLKVYRGKVVDLHERKEMKQPSFPWSGAGGEGVIWMFCVSICIYIHTMKRGCFFITSPFKHTHTHTHVFDTHAQKRMYVYIYIYICIHT